MGQPNTAALGGNTKLEVRRKHAGKIFDLNQQGDRGSLPGGPANARAVTYAIYGPF